MSGHVQVAFETRQGRSDKLLRSSHVGESCSFVQNPSSMDALPKGRPDVRRGLRATATKQSGSAIGLLSLLWAEEVTRTILRAIFVAFCESVHQSHARSKESKGEQQVGGVVARRQITFLT